MAIDVGAPNPASPVSPLPGPSVAVPPRVELVREVRPAAPLVKVGVIGYGYWGANCPPNFAEIPGSQLLAVSDLREERLSDAAARYPAITTTTDCYAVIADPAIDAVVITPPF